MKNVYTLQIRSQHSVGSSSSRFGGPDRYVAVTIAPEGISVPYTLRQDVLAKRGIQIKYFGQGYSRNCRTQRSMLCRAISSAEAFITSQQSA